MQLRMPPALQRGDEVAVVLPSSAVRDRGALDRGMDRLRAWGLRPSLVGDGDPCRGLDWPEGSELAAEEVHEVKAEARSSRDFSRELGDFFDGLGPAAYAQEAPPPDSESDDETKTPS